MLKLSITKMLAGPNHLSDYDFIQGSIDVIPFPDPKAEKAYLTKLRQSLTTALGFEQEILSSVEAFTEIITYIKSISPPSLIKSLKWAQNSDTGIVTGFMIESRSKELIHQLLQLLQNHFKPGGNSENLGGAIYSVTDMIGSKSYLNNSNDLMLESAERLKIPVLHFKPQSPIMMMGYGQSRRLLGVSLSNKCGVLSDKLTHDKFQTQSLLKRFGFPTPGTRTIRSERDLKAAAINPGFPMVIKPLDGLQGRGVSLNIRNMEEAITAFHWARRINPTVLAERYVPGHDIRVMILNGKATHAVSRRIPTVVGDGKHSISELMDIENVANPLRVVTSYSHNPIKKNDIGEEVLKKRGLDYDYVPQHREVMELHNAPNIKRGGRCLNLMDHIHPANLRLAEEAAALFDIPIAGVDLVSADCSKPYWENDGIIVEINSMPHLRPICAVDQENYESIVDEFVLAVMAPKPKTPTHLTVIAGGAAPDDLAKSLYNSLSEQGKNVGLYTNKLTTANGFQLQAEGSRQDKIHALLFNKNLDHILISENLRLIHSQGLGYRYIDNLWIEDMPATEPEREALNLLIRQVQKQVIIPPARTDLRQFILQVNAKMKIEENV